MDMKHEATKRFVKEQTPGVVLQPLTYRALERGVNLLVEAIKPTLGPMPRYVAIEEPEQSRFPEILDNGALIARRIIELPDRDADMGAMLFRQMLWQLYERVGDGTATAAVIFQSLFHDGLRYLAAGGNAQQLRELLLTGMKRVIDQIWSQSIPIEEREQLQQFACSVTHDDQLAEILTEAFDILGPFGQINLRTGYTEEYQREYLHGILWESGVHSPNMLFDTINQKTEMDFTAILATDFEFDDPNDLVPIIDVAAQHYSNLVIIARNLSERVIGLINYVNQQPKSFRLIAVKLPTEHLQQYLMLEEIEIVTGGRALRQDVGDVPGAVTLKNFGRAKKIWTTRDFFCIEETDETKDEYRKNYILQLQKQFDEACPQNKEQIRQRIARLMGASATITVGGVNDRHIKDRKETIKRYVSVIRSAYQYGIVAGGGLALLTAQNSLIDKLSTANSEERVVYQMLAKAMEAPIRAIVSNAGYHPSSVLNQDKNNYFFDAKGKLQVNDAPMIFDSCSVVVDAFESAVRTTAIALTIDVLVHRRRPEFSAVP